MDNSTLSEAPESEDSHTCTIDTGFGTVNTWRVADLWEAAKGRPIITVDIKDLGVLNRWFWEDTPTLQTFIKHMERVQLAKAQYPILLSPTGRVLDGIHRIAAAVLRGEGTIEAQLLAVMPKPVLVNKTKYPFQRKEPDCLSSQQPIKGQTSLL